MAENNPTLFTDATYDEIVNNLYKDEEHKGPVTVFGKTFQNDNERREYYRQELKKMLPELRAMEGFPNGSDEDIINLSDPPYYTACPNPWFNNFIEEWEKEQDELSKSGERNESMRTAEPFVNDISEGKYNDIYFKHPYHTKVPIAAIEQYLKHYTLPGDIIFDGFAGTGMTGVAAQLTDRKLKSITLDLAPIASYINYYYNYPASPKYSRPFLLNQFNKLQEQYSWLYETKHTNGDKGTISSVIWSEVFVCPTCGEELVFWDNGVDVENGKVLDNITCKRCGSQFKKNNDNKFFEAFYDDEVNIASRRVKIVPIRITYSYAGRSYYKTPDADDIQLLDTIQSFTIPNWFPSYQIPKGEKTQDAIKTGIEYVHQLYFKRSLIVLSALRDMLDINTLGILTSVAFRINKRYALTYMAGKWGAGGGPTNGTYYIPSLLKELNIFDVLDNASQKCYNAYFNASYESVISTQSATSVQLKDNSVDYIFTDPPFGGNFIYSELNFIWESWLKVFTENSKESITSATYNKGYEEYKNLMTTAFKEYCRILKPGRWLSVEFSNTKAAIWNILQNSLKDAGFIIANVAALDKKKGSFNAQTSVTAVKQDLVITCYKPLSSKFGEVASLESVDSLWDFVDNHLSHLPVYLSKNDSTYTIVERSPRVIFDRVISYYVANGLQIPIDSIEFIKGIDDRYIQKDGMVFTPSQAAQYDERKKECPTIYSMGLIINNEVDGIEWLKNKLNNKRLSYQEIQPDWLQAIGSLRRHDVLPELKTILDENFIQEEDGKWRIANSQDDIDKYALRTKALLKEFKLYVEQASKPKAKIKEVRVEAVRAGFKQCYIDKDFQTIVTVGDKIPQNLLEEDEILLQFYDIAVNHV